MELSEDDIQRLIARARGGETDCVGQLYEIYKDRIYRYFLFRVNTVEAAEDLTQTLFLEMVRSLQRYTVRTEAKFSTWLFQIARHKLIDHYRKRNDHLPLESINEAGNANLYVEQEEVHLDTRSAAVQDMLSRLPEKFQTVLHLTFVEELSHEEIGNILGVTALHVRVLKFRAIKKLKTLLHNG